MLQELCGVFNVQFFEHPLGEGVDVIEQPGERVREGVVVG
jgi:hypothetical protein